MRALLLFAFIWPFTPEVKVDKTDYIGTIASYAAYAGMKATGNSPKPKVPTKDCTTCNGTGKVPTGDSNHPWTDCPDCEGLE